MARDRWVVYICPDCGELNLYPGVCDNRDAHTGEEKMVYLVATTVAPAHAPSQDKLSELQQPEGIQADAQGGS